MKTTIHAPGKTPGAQHGYVSPNIFRLTIHWNNEDGSNTFKTTEIFDNINDKTHAMLLINGKIKNVRVAYWNGKKIAEDGVYINGWGD